MRAARTPGCRSSQTCQIEVDLELGRAVRRLPAERPLAFGHVEPPLAGPSDLEPSPLEGIREILGEARVADVDLHRTGTRAPNWPQGAQAT